MGFTINHGICLLGEAVDMFGVAVIVFGIIWSTRVFLQKTRDGNRYDLYRIRIGRSLLLGLEILVAADIIKTIALESSFSSLGILAGLVLIRTFLNWTLASEIDRMAPSAARNAGPEALTKDISL